MPLASGVTWSALALVGGGLVAALSGAWAAHEAVQSVVERRVAPVERRLGDTDRGLAKLVIDVAVIRAIVEREANAWMRQRLPAAAATSPAVP